MTLKLETLREILRQSSNDLSERYFEQMLEAIALDFLDKNVGIVDRDLKHESSEQNTRKNRYHTVNRQITIECNTSDIYGDTALEVEYSKEFLFEFENGHGEIPDSSEIHLEEVEIKKIKLHWFDNEFEITGFDSVRDKLIELLQE